MPTPLPPDKRQRLYQGMKARGMAPAEIAHEFDMLEGYAPLSADITPSVGQSLDRAKIKSPPVTPEEQAAAHEFATRTLPRAGIVGAAGLAAAPFTAGMSMIPAALTEAGAAGLGDLVYQHGRNVVEGKARVMPGFGEDISLPEAGGAAVAAGLGVPAGRGLSKVLEFLGRVPSELSSEFFRQPKNMLRYTRTFGQLPKDAEMAAAEGAQGLRPSIEEIVSRPIPERQAKEAIISQATASGTKLRATDIRAALAGAKIPNAKTDIAKAANAKIDALMEEFTRVKRAVPSDIGAGRISSTNVRAIKNVTPQELDDFLVRELDDSIYRQSGEPKDQILAKALAEVRPRVKASLEKMVPTADLTAKISKEMDFRKDAAQLINPELKTLEQFITNLHKPGHETERQMVVEVGKRLGIDLEGALFRINQKRAFSGDPRVARKGVDFLWDAASALPKLGLKIYAPAESLAAPAAGAAAAGISEQARVVADREKRRIALKEKTP